MLVCMLYVGHIRAGMEQERSDTLKRYGGEMVTLVVARRTIEPGEVLSLSDLEMRDWISSLAPEGAVLDLNDAIGKEISVPLAKNAPLTDLNFRDMSQLSDIPSGHVAVSVPITEKLGVPAGIEVGARVVAYRAKEGASELICGNAIVLASPSASSSSLARGTLTIAVRAEDVPAVLSASTSGDLRLVVPAEDVKKLAGPTTGTTDVEPVRQQEHAVENAEEGQDD